MRGGYVVILLLLHNPITVSAPPVIDLSLQRHPQRARFPPGLTILRVHIKCRQIFCCRHSSGPHGRPVYPLCWFYPASSQAVKFQLYQVRHTSQSGMDFPYSAEPIKMSAHLKAGLLQKTGFTKLTSLNVIYGSQKVEMLHRFNCRQKQKWKEKGLVWFQGVIENKQNSITHQYFKWATLESMTL